MSILLSSVGIKSRFNKCDSISELSKCLESAKCRLDKLGQIQVFDQFADPQIPDEYISIKEISNKIIAICKQCKGCNFSGQVDHENLAYLKIKVCKINKEGNQLFSQQGTIFQKIKAVLERSHHLDELALNKAVEECKKSEWEFIKKLAEEFEKAIQPDFNGSDSDLIKSIQGISDKYVLSRLFSLLEQKKLIPIIAFPEFKKILIENGNLHFFKSRFKVIGLFRKLGATFLTEYYKEPEKLPPTSLLAENLCEFYLELDQARKSDSISKIPNFKPQDCGDFFHFIWMGKPFSSREKEKSSLLDWKKAYPDKMLILWSNTMDDQTKAWCAENNIILVKISDVFSGSQFFLKDFFTYELLRIPPNYGGASDILRMEILYKLGGFYTDITNSPNSIINQKESVMSVDELGRNLSGTQFASCNDIMISRKAKNTVFLKMMNKYEKLSKNYQTRYFLRTRGNVIEHEPCYAVQTREISGRAHAVVDEVDGFGYKNNQYIRVGWIESTLSWVVTVRSFSENWSPNNEDEEKKMIKQIACTLLDEAIRITGKLNLLKFNPLFDKFKNPEQARAAVVQYLLDNKHILKDNIRSIIADKESYQLFLDHSVVEVKDLNQYYAIKEAKKQGNTDLVKFFSE